MGDSKKLLTKKEVLEELADVNVTSIRTIERYVSKGLLHPTEGPGKTRSIALFDPDEVARLKDQIKQGNKTATSDQTASVGIVAKKEQSALALFDMLKGLGGDAAKGQRAGARLVAIDEAAEYSGISQNKLEELFHTGKIKAHKNEYGRGWRVSLKQLDKFLAKL